MEKIKVKTFLEALKCYPDNLKKFDHFLRDKRLSETEKKILRSWLLLRNKEFTEIINLLTPISSPSKTVESQRELLIGIALNNRGDFQGAIPRLERSLELLGGIDLEREKFTAYYNLFIVFWNLENQEKMEKVLDEFDQLELKSESLKIDGLRMKFNYFTFVNNFPKADFYLKELEHKKNEFSTFQATCLYIDKFIYFLRQDKFSHCLKLLEEMKSSRKFTPTESYKYMQGLLGFVMGKTELYLYPNDFIDHPFYYQEIRYLTSLDKGDLAQAQSAWNELSKWYPHLYGREYNYLGRRCLFSLALDKINSKKFKVNIASLKQEKGEDIGEYLYRIIQSLDGAYISKEDLYYRLYGKELIEERDSKKLSELIRRQKLKYDLEVQSRKGFYSIQIKKVA